MRTKTDRQPGNLVRRLPPALLLAALLALASTGQAQEAASGPYHEVATREGFIACAPRPYTASAESCPVAGGDDRTDFRIDHAANATGVLVLVDWTPATQQGADRLRVVVGPGSAETGSETSGPPVRVALDWSAAPIRSAGDVRVAVTAPTDGPPGVIADQPFDVVVGLYYGGLVAPDEGLIPEPVDLDSAEESEPAADTTAADAGGRAGWQVVALVLAPLLVLAWAAVRWRAVASSFFVGLFSRLDEDAVVNHPRRRRILEAVRAKPGRIAEDVRRAVGLANGSFEHHLRILLRHGAIVRRTVEGAVCIFPVGARSDAAPTGPLRSRILWALRDRPGLGPMELSERLGVDAKRIRYHVKRLERQGRLRVEPAGREVRCFPSP